MLNKMPTPSMGGGGSATASGTSFDNTTAQLPNDPKDVQGAIEEVNGKVDERLKPIDPSIYEDVLSSVGTGGGVWIAPKTGWLAIRGVGTGAGDPAISVYAGTYDATHDFPIASQQSAIAGAWQGICVPVKEGCSYTIIAVRSTVNKAILYY